MNYTEAIQYLYDLRLFGVKLGLENTFRLAELAGRPQDKLRFIHVAGTNGKGSTCAMLEGIYRAAVLRVGLFTSPHLVSFSERIQVNRQPIATEDVARLVEVIKQGSEEAEIVPTFFEVVTVLALKYFAEQRCELVVWETGMGGRLDATNIVTPLASVITNVQLDHQQWLGQMVAEIAREKVGIIKQNVPVVTSAEDETALRIIGETAEKLHAPLSVVTRADAEAMDGYEIALAGKHQRLNATLAARVVEVLGKELAVPEAALRRGLKETQWFGRQQIIRRENGQMVLLDGAHNPAGAQTLAETVAGKEPTLILGIMNDKDCAAVCDILAPLARKILLVPIGSERSANPQAIAGHCQKANPSAELFVCESLREAFAGAAKEPFVVVTGSLYLVGEALEHLGAVAPSPERALNEYGAAPIRAVTFDIGGTLIEPWPSVGEVYSRVAERHGVQVSPGVLNQRFAAAWRDKKNFNHLQSDWKALVEAVFSGYHATPALFSELYAAFTDPRAWRIYDDARPCLERLKQNGFKLGAISNWDERLRPLLRGLDLERYFDAIIISCEVGQPKPAQEIFRAGASQLGTLPQNVLHIGDSRREDFDGAKAAGFQALLLTRGEGETENDVVTGLNEVAERLSGNKLGSEPKQGVLISVN